MPRFLVLVAAAVLASAGAASPATLGEQRVLMMLSDPFSVMGHGLSDYGAWEKHMFGWLDRVAAPAPRVSLGAIDRPGRSAQALRVVVAGDEYWFEYRPPVPAWPYASDAAPGVAIHVGWNGLAEPSRFAGRNLLLHDPVRRGRPSVQAGETFAVRGAFSVRVDSAGSDTAELAFRGADRTRPARPRIVGARVRGARLFLRWLRGSERGSGIAAHEVYVDGRRAGRVAASGTLGSLAIANDDAFAIRVRPGRHTVTVVAVDRAGNRSRPARRVAKRT